MKKTIAQAKVCVISKLVKKLRDAKKQLEAADAKPLKLSTRPAKLAEQIDYLKRAGNVELATKCLVDRRNAQQVLTNPQASNADVAWAQLSAFKTVVARVAQIKAKYGLEETDVDWRTAIGETGKKKQKKTVKEAHLKRKAEQKERADKEKAAEQKRNEWLEENADDADKEPKDSTENSDASGSDDDDKSEQLDEVDNANAPDKSSVSDDANESKAEVTKEPKLAKKQTKVEKSTAPTSKTTVKPPIKTKSTPAAVKPKPTKPTPNQTASIPEQPKPAAPQMQMDSFFVTSGGSAYMSTGFEARHQPLGPNDGMDRRERRAMQFGKAPPRGKTARPTPRLASQSHERLQPTGRNDTSRYQKPVTVSAAADVDLHPSWAAKQRTKGIASFQGSKKTFGDDEGTDDQPPAAKRAYVAPASRGAAPSTDTDAAAKLHPSWLAKQKLKPVISAFQGKKITFD